MPRWSLLACALILVLSSPLQAASDNALRFDISVKSLEPELISPNGDGVLDDASAEVEFFCRSAALAAPGQEKEKDAIDRVYKVVWTVRLNPQAGGSSLPGPSGTHLLNPTSDADWRNGIRSVASIAISGLNTASQTLPSGRYTLELSATFLRETTVRLNSKQPPKVQTLIVASSSANLGSIEIDVTPPALDLSSPNDGLLTNQNTLLVSGTASDPNLESVMVNGEYVTLAGGAFSHSVSLAEGTNAITVEARDIAGNSTTVERTVTLDTTPPAISSVLPLNGIWTRESSALVSANVIDDHLVAVRINGEAAALVSGRYQLNVSLIAEG